MSRTREAGSRDEVEGAVANTLDVFRDGAVGFIDWLDLRGVCCMHSPQSPGGRTSLCYDREALDSREVKNY